MTSIPLIPRHVFFGNPDRAQVTISPDGTHLAWLAHATACSTSGWPRATTRPPPAP